MGNRLVKFEFCPEENEQLEACVIVPKEERSVIHGIVKNHAHCVVKDAVVIIFEIKSICGKVNLIPIGHTFTDEHGQFVFGPLCPDRHYVVKIWINEIKVRKLCIAPPPGHECDKPHHPGSECDPPHHPGRECEHDTPGRECEHDHPVFKCGSNSDEANDEDDLIDDEDSD